MRISFLLSALRNRWYGWRLRRTANVFARGRIRVDAKPVVTVYGRLNFGEGVLLRSNPRGYHGPMGSPVIITVDPGAEVTIGDGCRLNGCAVVAWKKVEIGKFCLIASNTAILDANGHSSADEDCYRRHEKTDTPEPVIIEDYVWIGLNCVITKGVRIGKCSIIAANSVVTRDIPPFSVAGGSPAKVIRQITPPKPTDSASS